MAKNNNVQSLANRSVSVVRNSRFMPYRTGNLSRNSVKSTTRIDGYTIYIGGRVAPYVGALEEGTRAHDIPGAFGRPLPFGIGGRFSNKFHPGSTKHKGFIENGIVPEVVEDLAVYFNGTITKGN